MDSNAVMSISNKVIYQESIDDETGNNPQEGFFAIKEMVGPFNTKEGAENYLRKPA